MKIRMPSVALPLAFVALLAELPAQCPPGGYPGNGGGGGGTAPPGPTTGIPAPRPIGPGDIVPPSTGGPRPAGPRTPSPSQPSSGPVTPRGPAPAAAPAPSTGGVAGPRGLPAGGRTGSPTGTGPRGMPIGEDLTSWRLWWEYNQDSHLPRIVEQLTAPTTGSDEFFLGATRSSRRDLRPSAQALAVDVLPALRRAIENGPTEVTASALLALGSVGAHSREFDRIELIGRHLSAAQQTVRENAALALGLTGDLRALERLRATLRGDGSDRTRAFAAYGLGMLGRELDDTRHKGRVFDELERVLVEEPDERDREVRIAALHAVGMLRIDSDSYAGTRLLDRVLARLDALLADEGRNGEADDLRAHCPTAIARLIGPDHRRSPRYRQHFAALLAGRKADGRRRAKVEHELAQTCALALGQLVGAGRDEDDVVVGRDDVQALLFDTWKSHKDAQTRAFAMLALGRLGGEQTRTQLIRTFHRASSAIEQPWCALALGLLSGETQRRTGAPDRLIVQMLEDAFEDAKNPEAAGALAVALGLSGADRVQDELVERLRNSAAKPVLAMSLCDSLAMIGDRQGTPQVRAFLGECDRLPELVGKAGETLGRLGDDEVANDFAARFVDGEANVSMQVAIADALSEIGDKRQVETLVALLDDVQRSAVTRAGAARALGGIARRGAMRWNTPLRANANYRADATTLCDRRSGVLDLR